MGGYEAWSARVDRLERAMKKAGYAASTISRFKKSILDGKTTVTNVLSYLGGPRGAHARGLMAKWTERDLSRRVKAGLQKKTRGGYTASHRIQKANPKKKMRVTPPVARVRSTPGAGKRGGKSSGGSKRTVKVAPMGIYTPPKPGKRESHPFYEGMAHSYKKGGKR